METYAFGLRQTIEGKPTDVWMVFEAKDNTSAFSSVASALRDLTYDPQQDVRLIMNDFHMVDEYDTYFGAVPEVNHTLHLYDLNNYTMNLVKQEDYLMTDLQPMVTFSVRNWVSRYL